MSGKLDSRQTKEGYGDKDGDAEQHSQMSHLPIDKYQKDLSHIESRIGRRLGRIVQKST